MPPLLPTDLSALLMSITTIIGVISVISVLSAFYTFYKRKRNRNNDVIVSEIGNDENRNVIVGRNIIEINLAPISLSPIAIGLGANLLSSMIQFMTRARDFKWRQEKTIVGLLIAKKIQSDTKTYIILFATIGGHLLFAAFSDMEVNYYLISFLVALIGSLNLNHRVIGYRIAKGFYGTNEYEAREIIQFILEHSDKTDFTDSGGQKKLMPDPEEIKELEGLPEGVYA